MSAALRSSTALWLLLVALVACTEEPLTQIVVVIDSDWDGFERAQIVIEGLGPKQRVNAEDLREGKPLPRYVALVHDGGPLGPIDITVNAYVKGIAEPQLVQPRTGIHFERGRTRMLRIELLFGCITQCKEADAPVCLGDDDCVRSNDPRAIALGDWDGTPGSLDVVHKLGEGAVLGDGGMPMPASDASLFPMQMPDADSPPTTGGAGSAGDPTVGGAAGEEVVDAEVDSGPPPEPTPIFPYTPTNFDPTSSKIADLERGAIRLDCGESIFDSTDRTFDNFCGEPPPVVVVRQSDGTDVAVFVMDTLEIASGSALRLRGPLPVILAVFGDAKIEGTVDASASGATPGAGADLDCESGLGGAGDDSGGTEGGGGGGGGGFGSPGAAGGDAVQSTNTAAGGSAGAMHDDATLSPLHGGCSGGAGGAGPNSSSGAAGGGGGGAVQISSAGQLSVYGSLLASGGGGQVGANRQDGGGGGGSGGAILLEAADLALDSDALIAANGGGGGAGQPSIGEAISEPGADGRPDAEPAAGGVAEPLGGDGGNGAALMTAAGAGSDGTAVFNTGPGGGGAGGGVGQIRLNQASSCEMRGVFSPNATIDCPSCGACYPPPAPGCELRRRDELIYFACPNALNWSEARAICVDAGMSLVAVSDEEENAWLTDQLVDETWLGATDSGGEGTWLWDRDGAEFWSGSASGSAVDGAYESWASAEPNNSDLRGDCAIVATDGTWLDRYCEETYPYVCER